MTTNWTAIAKEPIPEGHAPVYVTDGTNVSYVQRAEQAFTEGERFIAAEPEVVHLRVDPMVSRPTHWATAIPGLPKVDAEELPVESAGGPPSEAELHPERAAEQAKAKK